MTSGTSFGEAFELTLLTKDPNLARRADRCGVQCIGVDLERLGKQQRQSGTGNRLSDHRLEDLIALRPVIQNAGLFVRLNPMHDLTAVEVEAVIEAGADIIMLPYFREEDEATRFLDLIGGRARAVLLVETSTALLEIERFCRLGGVQGITFGLNDLRHEFRVTSHFDVLCSPLMEAAAQSVLRAGLPVTLGGVGRVGDRTLPIPAELVHAQYPRLGATGAWLARSFLDRIDDFEFAIDQLRASLTEWAAKPREELEGARRQLLELLG